MGSKDRDLDTICAVATPSGVGGISVIRVSGPMALAITRRLCGFLPEEPESHRVYFGLLKSASETSQRDVIDEVVVTYFAKGRSFTNEQTLEISSHGNPVIAREILSQLVSAGARTADRGEFTYRAFMNGRIDLVQAESVLALIESQSIQSAKQALHQLQGTVSKELTDIEDLIIWCLAHMEASIDFSTEDIEVVADSTLMEKISTLRLRIQRLLDSFKKGQLLKEGFRLILTGIPNVGKSSLLNLLVGEDRAIVTDIPGTTRDLIEGHFFISGLKVNVVDTAGLRESSDYIERLGIERSLQAQKEANGIFFVFDSSVGLSHDELKKLSTLPLDRTFLIGNKADQGSLSLEERKIRAWTSLESSPVFESFQSFLPNLKEKIYMVSALDKNGGEELKRIISNYIGKVEFEDQAVISQARHFEKLQAAYQNMEQALELVNQQASPEFMSLEMKEALLSIQEIIGKRFDDQVMDRVFKEFCIGK